MFTLLTFSSNNNFFLEDAKRAVLRNLGSTEILRKILLTLSQNNGSGSRLFSTIYKCVCVCARTRVQLPLTYGQIQWADYRAGHLHFHNLSTSFYYYYLEII